jgi:hypothetical protein
MFVGRGNSLPVSPLNQAETYAEKMAIDGVKLTKNKNYLQGWPEK